MVGLCLRNPLKRHRVQPAIAQSNTPGPVSSFFCSFADSNSGPAE
jgi:hypothetical protein